jgi:adenylylsulfate kinase
MELDGITVWFTGLSGSGKSTIATELAKILRRQGYKVEVLDGDIVRKSFTRDLGYSRAERDKNIRCIGFVANLLSRNGVIVLVSVLSPYRDIGEEVGREIGNFIEVYVKAPLEVCQERDVKGLYKRVRAGEIPGFTGMDDPYELPLQPQVGCFTNREKVTESVAKLMDKLEFFGAISALCYAQI